MTKGSNQDTGVRAIGTEDVVPRSLFDVTHMPPKQAVEAWHEGIGTVCGPRLHDAPEQKLIGRLESWHLGEAILGLLDSVSQDFKRSRSHIASTDSECYTVIFLPDGVAYFPNEEQFARAGDMIVLDQETPYAVSMKALKAGTGFHSCQTLIPKRLLDPFVTDSRRESVRIFDSRQPLVTLLRQHLYTLAAQLPIMTLSDAQSVIQPTVELLSAAMNGAVAETNANAVQHAVVREIQRHIEAHIEDPALSAATIAATFGISTRKLYQLFEPLGGVVAYIQKKRLGLVHAALVDPAHQHRRIQDIAEGFGFMHRKNFNTAFRRLYGITPREVRGYAADGRSRNMRRAYTNQVCWDWIVSLR